MDNVSIVSVYRNPVWERSEAVSFLREHNCKISLNYFKQAPKEDELIGILNKRPYSGTHNEKPVKTHIKRIDITFARTGMLPVSM